MRIAIITLLSLVAAMLLCGCCDDCPTKPDDPPEVEEHYRVYVSAIDMNTHAHSINVIDTPADTLIDSVTLGHGAESFQLTPDNRKVLFRNMSGLNTLIYDAETLTPTDTFDIMGPFFIDRQRNIIMIDSLDWLFTVDPQTFEITQRMQLPTAFTYAQVHEPTNTLYICNRTSTLYLIDYVNLQVRDSLLVTSPDIESISVWDFVPVPEYSRLFFYGTESAGTFAYVYDTDSNKVVSRLPHTTAFGSFARTGNGSTVYKCDPGRTFLDEHGSYLIWVYDVPTDQVAGLYTTLIGDTLGYRKIDVAELILTPNERYLLATATMELALLRYDLSTGLATSAFSFMYPKMPLHVEVGERIM